MCSLRMDFRSRNYLPDVVSARNRLRWTCVLKSISIEVWDNVRHKRPSPTAMPQLINVELLYPDVSLLVTGNIMERDTR
jgi:hypothetical protein